MNKDLVKSGLKEAAGKVQGKTGHVLGRKSQENKGMAKEVTGKAEKALADAKETMKDFGHCEG